MKPSTFVKICGMTREQDVIAAADLGANYIGLIFHGPSKRNVTIETATQLAACAKKHNLIPVGVFVDQDESAIRSICDSVKLDTVQCHGATAKAAAQSLSSQYNIIYACDKTRDIENAISTLNPTKDFILLDSCQPGSGTKAKLTELLANKIDFPYFIAGGLEADNVAAIIMRYHPSGVDVASGVESEPGIKNPSLINEFIHHARTK